MNETDYNARLYEKMKAEQDKYRDWLLHQEPSEILNHTYEYTMREDIVMCMEELELEPEKAKGFAVTNGRQALKLAPQASNVQYVRERGCFEVITTLKVSSLSLRRNGRPRMSR